MWNFFPHKRIFLRYLNRNFEREGKFVITFNLKNIVSSSYPASSKTITTKAPQIKFPPKLELKAQIENITSFCTPPQAFFAFHKPRHPHPPRIDSSVVYYRNLSECKLFIICLEMNTLIFDLASGVRIYYATSPHQAASKTALRKPTHPKARIQSHGNFK